jgi:murein DD-endopeptidase MepM/ murein hydrolase activator NlpD
MKYTLSDIFEGQYPVSQYYGVNPAYYKPYGLAGHEGVDWATPVGVRLVVPFETGKILRTGWDPVYGYYIVIWDASQKCAVWYCHLSSINVSAGQSIPRGKLVGYTGNSGNSQGPHLHCNLVETDQYANRLNTNNGFQGFLNILDPNLVTWQLGGVTPPMNDTQKVNAVTKEMQSTNSNDTKVNNIRKILGL